MGFACMGRCIKWLVSAGVLPAACGWHLPPSGMGRIPSCKTLFNPAEGGGLERRGARRPPAAVQPAA